MRYIIGSGWWCAGEEKDRRDRFFGDDSIRGYEFHRIWYQSICRYTNPQKIIIVDSNSPVKPDISKLDDRIEFISLNINAGHSTNHIGKFSGCVRAMMLGLEYTLQCETDYYVYVEQDCLLYGNRIIEYCIENMNQPYMFGNGEGTPQRTQQSLFIIRQDGIQYFLNRLNKIVERDNEISPEEKFHLACLKGPISILSKTSKSSSKNIFAKWLDWQFTKYLRHYDYLPIGYGRVRPIKFKDDYFYFQHGNYEELEQYFALSGIEK